MRYQLTRGISYLALAVLFCVVTIIRTQEGGVAYAMIGAAFVVAFVVLGARCLYLFKHGDKDADKAVTEEAVDAQDEPDEPDEPDEQDAQDEGEQADK